MSFYTIFNYKDNRTKTAIAIIDFKLSPAIFL